VVNETSKKKPPLSMRTVRVLYHREQKRLSEIDFRNGLFHTGFVV
jgi:hypothetical protein